MSNTLLGIFLSLSIKQVFCQGPTPRSIMNYPHQRNRNTTYLSVPLYSKEVHYEYISGTLGQFVSFSYGLMYEQE